MVIIFSSGNNSTNNFYCHVNTAYRGLVEDWLRIGWGFNEEQLSQSSTDSLQILTDSTLYLKQKSVMCKQTQKTFVFTTYPVYWFLMIWNKTVYSFEKHIIHQIYISKKRSGNLNDRYSGINSNFFINFKNVKQNRINICFTLIGIWLH